MIDSKALLEKSDLVIKSNLAETMKLQNQLSPAVEESRWKCLPDIYSSEMLFNND